MLVSRKIIKRLVLREIRSIMGNKNLVFESDLLDNLVDGEDADSIVEKIKKIKNVENIILIALKDTSGQTAFRDAILKLDDEKKQLVLDVFGKLRGILTPSTFEKLKASSGLEF